MRLAVLAIAACTVAVAGSLVGYQMLAGSAVFTVRDLAITGHGAQAITLMGGNNGNVGIHITGNRIYGNFHNMQVGAGNPADAGQGRLIPGYSVDQYGATLAKWMGASATDLGTVFPNLQNFSLTDLGFLV